MTKQETAQQIVKQVLEFMADNKYLRTTYYVKGMRQASPVPVDIHCDDIEQLQDIAQASIEEFMGYVAKGTLRND
tara:strand:- start:358 stop:582 length:225 start_codon:yes stop_codon:yes gene_type:complete